MTDTPHDDAEPVKLENWREEIGHPNSRLLFRRMMEAAGIVLGEDDVVSALAKVGRLTQLEGENAATQAVLADPIAVHLNMLRGGIAKPSLRNIIHLYGADNLRAALNDKGSANG